MSYIYPKEIEGENISPAYIDALQRREDTFNIGYRKYRLKILEIFKREYASINFKEGGEYSFEISYTDIHDVHSSTSSNHAEFDYEEEECPSVNDEISEKELIVYTFEKLQEEGVVTGYREQYIKDDFGYTEMIIFTVDEDKVSNNGSNVQLLHRESNHFYFTVNGEYIYYLDKKLEIDRINVRYYKIFKEIILDSKIINGERKIRDKEKTYRTSVLPSINNLLVRNGIQNINTRLREPIIHITDCYIYFNNIIN